MRLFFDKILKSLFSFNFYQHLGSLSFSSSVKFYLLFLLLAAFVRSIPIWVGIIPTIVGYTDTALTELASSYPADLQLSWDGTTLHSSQNPLTVPYPSSWDLTKLPFRDQQKVLAVIETTSTDLPPQADALLTISNQTVFIPTPEQTTEQMPLQTFLNQPFALTAQTIPSYIEYWQTIKTSVVTGLAIATPLSLLILLFLQRLLMLFLEGSLFYVFKKVLGSDWQYSTTLQYTLHFFVPAEIIDFVSQLVYPESTFSIFSLTVWLYFFAVTLYPSFRRWQAMQPQ
jgi:hypothetical protein